MMDHDDPLYFDMKKEKVGALTILTPSLRLLTVDSLQQSHPPVHLSPSRPLSKCRRGCSPYWNHDGCPRLFSLLLFVLQRWHMVGLLFGMSAFGRSAVLLLFLYSAIFRKAVLTILTPRLTNQPSKSIRTLRSCVPKRRTALTFAALLGK
jgi:hypothetical protein